MAIENAKMRILVEGPNDRHAVKHLLLAHNIEFKRDSDIQECGNLSELLKAIGDTIKSNYCVAIVCDANGDFPARQASVFERLRKIGVDIPATVQMPCVLDAPSANQKVGVWIMPDNKSPGALENFLAGLIPAEDPCWPYAQEACKEAKRLGALFKDAHRSKAELHTWLAWQDEPGRPYGTAIRSTSFNSQHPDAVAFVTWVKSVFQL